MNMAIVSTLLLLMAVFASSALLAGEPENLARKARVTVSSVRSDTTKEGAVDGNPASFWASDEESREPWIQLDWDQPQTVSAVVFYETIQWAEILDVQVKQGDEWLTVGHVEMRGYGSVGTNFPNDYLPNLSKIAFAPQSTNSLRVLIKGVAAVREVGVYSDTDAFRHLYNPEVVAYGDLRGHLIGTFSEGEGSIGVEDAEVTVTGASPLGKWTRTARTGTNGLFEVDLPLGTTGLIKVSASKDGYNARTTLDSSDIAKRLTPRPTLPSKDRLTLDGQWDFAVDPPAAFPANSDSLKWSKIKVPAHWEMEGFVSRHDMGAYRRSFRIPADWAGKRIKLRPEAIYSKCEVWINGKRVGGHEGGTTPFELDITEAAMPGSDNTISVLVTARSLSHAIDKASNFAYYELAGIWQTIEVFCVEPAHISRLALITTFDKDYRDAELSVDIDISNEQAKAVKNAQLKLTLFDPQGRKVPVEGFSRKVSVDGWSANSLNLTAPVPSPDQWNAERPRLYKLVAEFSSGGIIRKIEQPFGFKQVEIKDGRVWTLNGKGVKLLGVCRLEAHPFEGRAVSEETTKLDAKMIKEANFNSVRQTIQPCHPAFLDEADRLGLYIEEEGPATFVGYPTSYDLRLAPLYISLMSEVVERDRNHPSVVIWSICNESDYNRVFQMAADFVRKSDPAHSICASGGPWFRVDTNADMVTGHHPVNMHRIQEASVYDKPMYFDEALSIFHYYDQFVHTVDIDPGLKDYWVTGIPEILEAISDTPNMVGVQTFAWSDDTALIPHKGLRNWVRFTNAPPIRAALEMYKMPGRGIVGEVLWGMVDGWRRQRPEVWLSKKLNSPIRIEEKPLNIPAEGEPVVVQVENCNYFTDLGHYTCHWEIGVDKGTLKSEIAPQSNGTITIPVKQRPKPSDILALRFYDEVGRLVDGYNLRFQPHAQVQLPNSGRPAEILEEVGRYHEGASCVRLLGTNVELTYDRSSGAMVYAIANDEQILLSGPELHVFRSEVETDDYPVGWQFTGETHAVEGGRAVINWNGRYANDFVGGYKIAMDDAGNIEIGYKFTYEGPGTWAREIGLQFDIPLQFDHLTWDRRAEYSFYPDDHIGRPVGKAVAHPKVAQTIPPGDRPWNLDDHPWGCNDFRSAKRNIYWASLTNAKGQGLKIISDGTQTVRAILGAHEITVKVMDFYGGSGSPYRYSSVGFHYGGGKQIKTGDVVKGTIRLQLLDEAKDE